MTMSRLMRVTWLKSVMIVLLTLIWAAASNHCKLEQVPLLAFLVCCQHEAAAPHADDDCESDGCASFENQLYKTENAQASVGKPATVFTPFLALLEGPAAAQAG